jgi:hypothetical protein
MTRLVIIAACLAAVGLLLLIVWGIAASSAWADEQMGIKDR